MRQEVKIVTLLTYDVDASLSRVDILSQIRIDISRLMGNVSGTGVELVEAQFGSLMEEAEIYGNGEG